MLLSYFVQRAAEQNTRRTHGNPLDLTRAGTWSWLHGHTTGECVLYQGANHISMSGTKHAGKTTPILTAVL